MSTDEPYAGDSGVSSILYGSWFTLAMAGGGGPQDTWRAPRGRSPLVSGVEVANGGRVGVEGTVGEGSFTESANRTSFGGLRWLVLELLVLAWVSFTCVEFGCVWGECGTEM